MTLFVEAIRLSHEKEDNIWIDSEAQKIVFTISPTLSNGCLLTTRRTRGGYMSIAVLGLLQFLPAREEKELRGMVLPHAQRQ